MATFTNETKNTASFLNFLRHGKEPIMSELENYTFESVVFMDGTVLKNVTFDDLANIVWANVSKNTANYSNVAKN